ncbi:MAG: ribonuclease HII [Rhodospirillales bacterium]|nr:ribonuclease HII [Rhodospirillales bacterium]
MAKGHLSVAGVDEAGRGPWAGPVVAAAVVLDRDTAPEVLLDALDDSKKLTAKQRRDVFAALADCAAIGVGQSDVDEIDRDNILVATLNAMARAIDALPARPDFALIDGNREPALDIPLRCVIKGDARSLSVAAASVVAKVTRDGIMRDLAETFPGYGWERNAGYGTAEHGRALEALGLTPHHRKSFAPILKILRRVTA